MVDRNNKQLPGRQAAWCDAHFAVFHQRRTCFCRFNMPSDSHSTNYPEGYLCHAASLPTLHCLSHAALTAPHCMHHPALSHHHPNTLPRQVTHLATYIFGTNRHVFHVDYCHCRYYCREYACHVATSCEMHPTMQKVTDKILETRPRKLPRMFSSPFSPLHPPHLCDEGLHPGQVDLGAIADVPTQGGQHLLVHLDHQVDGTLQKNKVRKVSYTIRSMAPCTRTRSGR